MVFSIFLCQHWCYAPHWYSSSTWEFSALHDSC